MTRSRHFPPAHGNDEFGGLAGAADGQMRPAGPRLVVRGRHVHVVNVENRGAIPNLPDYACVAVEAVTDSVGVRPICTGPAPMAVLGLLQQRIA